MNKKDIIQELANGCVKERDIYYLDVKALAQPGEETFALPMGDANGNLIGLCVVHSYAEDGETLTYEEEFECSFPNIMESA